MEFEIEEEVLFDASTNPSLVHRPRVTPSRHTRLYGWNRSRQPAPGQKAVVIPEEEDQLS